MQRNEKLTVPEKKVDKPNGNGNGNGSSEPTEPDYLDLILIQVIQISQRAEERLEELVRDTG